MGAVMKMGSIMFITATLFSLCSLLTASSCPSGWTGLLDSCYLVDRGGVRSWFEAQEYCWTQGGYLAEITSAAENELLRVGLLDMNTDFWIGLEDFAHEGTWRWAESHQKASWTNWNTGEPNSHSGDEDCVTMSSQPGRECRWLDTPCYYSIYNTL